MLKNKNYLTKPNKNVFNLLLIPWIIGIIGMIIFLIISFIISTSRFDEFFFYIFIMVIISFLALKYLRWIYFGNEILIFNENKIEIIYKYPFFQKNRTIDIKSIYEIAHETHHLRYHINTKGKIRMRCFGEVIFFGQGLNKSDSISLSKDIKEEIEYRKSLQ